MKQNQDSKKADELLKKLQASFLGSAANKKKTVEDEPSAEDLAFQEKLAKLLNQATADTSSEKKKEKKRSAAKTNKKEKDSPLLRETTEEEVVEMPSAEEISEVFDTPSEEPATEMPDEAPCDAPSLTAKADEPDVEALEPSVTAAVPPKPKKKRSAGKPRAQKTPVEEESPASLSAAASDEDVALPEEASPKEEIKEEITDAEVTEADAADADVPEVQALQALQAEETEKETASVETVIEERIDPSPEQPGDTAEETDDNSIVPAKETETPLQTSAQKSPSAPIDKPTPPPVQKISIPMPTQRPAKTFAFDDAPSVTPPHKEQRPSVQPPTIPKLPAVDAPIKVTPPTPVASPAKKTEEKDTIVIKPKQQPTQQAEPIVIRPKTDESAPTVSAPLAEESQAPIRIGRASGGITLPKESTDTPRYRKADAPPVTTEEHSATPAEPTAPSRKPLKLPKLQPPSGAVSPASSAASKKVAAEQPPLQTAAKEKSPAARPTPKRKIRSINRTPVISLPEEEESYDEALDELVEDEAQLEEIPYEEPEVVQSQQRSPGSPAERQKQLRHAREEKTLPIYELIRKKTGLDEHDIAMIFELGYDNELGRLVGYENLKKLKAEHLRRISQGDKKHYRTAFGYRGEEYTGQTRESVMAAYTKDKHVMIRRIIFSFVLTALLLVLDFPQIMGGELLRIDTSLPFLFPLLSLVCLSLTVLLSHKQLNAGMRTFFKFAATPYSAPALLTPFLLAYGVLQILFPTAGMLKVAFPAAVLFLLVTIADACRLVGEMRSFTILSTEEEKNVLVPAATRKKKLRYGDKIVKIINDDVGDAFYRVQTAKETTGFFRRFNTMDAAVRPFSILISLSFAMSFLGGIGYSVFVNPDPLQSLSMAMAVLTVSAPVGAVFSFFYPLFRANALLHKKNCTLVGEESVTELAQPKTVIFDDCDMYVAQKCNEIAVRQSDDFKEDLLIAGILFRRLASTLSGIGKTSPKVKDGDPPVTIVRISNHGIEAVINNSHHVLAGNAEFLQKGGVRVPKETMDKAYRRIGNVSVMYVAINSVLKLSYELEYRTYRSFEEMAVQLADHKTAVAIHSYDPNLNDSFLQSSRIDTAEPVRVIKPGRFEIGSTLEVTDTAAVALGKKTDVAYPIYAACSVERTRRDGMLFHGLLSVAGSVLASALFFTGNGALVSLFTLAGFHLGVFALSILHTHLRLNFGTLHLHASQKNSNR